LTGSQILVSIFDDRLEIQNPGSFVYGSTIETIKQGISRVRNRAIVRILRELDLMEILGSGYERISTTFENGYPEPDWREIGVVVRVTIPTHPFFAEGDDGSREGDEGDRLIDGPSMSAHQRAEWVLAEIDAGRAVTNQYLAKAIGLSLATVERLTRSMQPPPHLILGSSRVNRTAATKTQIQETTARSSEAKKPHSRRRMGRGSSSDA
jgi:ATP-dependent DNA helicase RecG